MAKITSGLPSGGSGTSTHNNLQGLNDGNYIHLTQLEKNKFDSIEDGAEVNVNTDWNSVSGDSELLNKPLSFPPSTHTHPISDIINLQYTLDSKVESVTGINIVSVDNTDNSTPIIDIIGTKSQFNNAVTDGDILYVGDITQYTDELAQDATGNILIDTSTIDFSYNDLTPSISADVKPDSITATHLSNSINISEFVNDSNYETTSQLNIRDNNNRARVNHTGTQLSSTISDFTTAARIATIDDNIVDGIIDKAPSQNIVFDSLQKKSFLSTGLIRNGLITINADPTKYNVAAGVGIVSDFTNPDNPTVVVVNFSSVTGKIPTYLNTSNITYVAINAAGTIVESAAPFTTTERRSLILLGAVIHSNLTTINVANNISNPVNAATNQLHDFMEAVGTLNTSGNKYSANGANLSLDKSAGTIFKLGVNFVNDWTRPHEMSQPSGTALTFRYRTQDGTEGSDVTVINPTVYDLNNVLTAIPNNKYSIQTVAMFQTGLTRILYDQSYYDSFAEAKVAIFTRSFNVEANVAANGMARAYIIVKKEATSLVTSGDAEIVEAQKFGGTTSGGTALTSATIIAALGYTPENVANKNNGILTTSSTTYPTSGAVKTAVDAKYGGSGTTNTIPKITGTNTIGNSSITDSGSLVTIANTIVPSSDNIYNLGSSGQRFNISNIRTMVASSVVGNTDLGLSSASSSASILFQSNSGGSTNGRIFGTTGNWVIQKDGTFTDNGFKLDVVGTFRQSGTLNASSAIARGSYITPTLVATANNDALIGLDIAPTYNTGAFTGVGKLDLRIQGTSPGIYFTNSGGSTRYGQIGANASEFFFNAQTNGLGFIANNDYAMKIFSSRNVLLQNGGTFVDNGIDKLQVTGTISASAATTANQVIIKSQLDAVTIPHLEFNITDKTVWNNGKGDIATNTSFGDLTLRLNTTGFNSTAIGYSAMSSNTTGFDITAIGNGALSSNTTGIGGVAIGKSAMIANTTGQYNMASGLSALGSNLTGSYNTGVGFFAGHYISDEVSSNTTGSNSVYIGSNTMPLGNGQTNQIVIGHGAKGGGDNTATLGNTSIVKTILRGVINYSTPYTVSTLPTGVVGDTAYVTDLLTPTYMTTAVGGGSVVWKVFFDGTSWKVD